MRIRGQVLSFIMAFMLLGAIAQARVWTVNQAGGADFTAWRAAVMNPSLASGDTIQFTDAAPVVYDESGSLIQWPAATNVTVTAATADLAVTLRGQIRIENFNTVSFNNLRFNRIGGTDYFIYNNQSTLTFTHCVFTNTSPVNWMHTLWSDAGTINCTDVVFDTVTDANSSFVIGDWIAAVNFTNCVFKNALGGAPVFYTGANYGMNITLSGCSTSGCTGDVFFHYAGNITATDSSLFTRGGKVLNVQFFTAKTIAADFTRCTFSSPGQYTICDISGNTFNGIFKNCVFKSAAVHLFGNANTASTMRAYNCVFANASSAVTNGAANMNDVFTLRNCIIDRSNAAGMNKAATMTVDSNYNLVNKAGSVTIGANSLNGTTTAIDPQFINAGGDYHILPSSPCAGVGVSLAEVPADIDNEARPQPAGTSPDIGIDEVQKATPRFYDTASNTTFPPYNTRVASQGFHYGTSRQPPATVLEQQAQEVLNLGGDHYKFTLDRNGYPEDMPDDPTITDIVDKINKMPAFQRTLDMPFKSISMWTYVMGPVTVNMHDGISPAESALEYNQLYDFASYLLQRYQGTGRMFLIGFWEGDWTLIDSMDPARDPTALQIQSMIDWITVRQLAVEDARDAHPECTNVSVLNYAECNLVQKAIDNPAKQVMANAVLPNVMVDAVSYSAYDACSSDYTKLPQRVYDHFNYIQSRAVTTGLWPYAKLPYTGEFGYVYGGNPTEQNRRNNLGLKAMAYWGSPIILYWSVYESATNLVLVKSDGSHTLEYGSLQHILADASTHRDASRVLKGRNPTEAEQNVLMDAWESKSSTQILSDAYASTDFSGAGSNTVFLQNLWNQILLSTTYSGTLWTNCINALNNSSRTRYNTLLYVLDSTDFKTAISNTRFARYILMQTLSKARGTVTASDITTIANSSSSRGTTTWQGKVNTDEWKFNGFKQRNEPRLSDITYERLMMDFRYLYFFENWRNLTDNTWTITQNNGSTGAATASGFLNFTTGATPVGNDPYLSSNDETLNLTNVPCLQVCIPFLTFGDRNRFYAKTSAGAWTLLHDEWYDVPGQNSGLVSTYNLATKLGVSGLQEILFRDELIKDQWSTPGQTAQTNFLWIKTCKAVPTVLAPTCSSPANGATVTSNPVLKWTAPTGFTNNLYSILISKSPNFNDSTTVILRDCVVGTSYQIAPPKLSSGTWYWTVSATEAGGGSGPFYARSLGADPRDPGQRSWMSFVVQ